MINDYNDGMEWDLLILYSYSAHVGVRERANPELAGIPLVALLYLIEPHRGSGKAQKAQLHNTFMYL